jgi:(2Fe-2S) ferredoxin
MAKHEGLPGAAKARRRLARTQRHVVVCVDTGEASCAGAKRMRRAWKHLGERLKDTGLDRKGRVLRSRSQCMGICGAGPIVAVHPDGVWYGGCDPDAIDRIVDEHLVRGKVVDDLVLHRMDRKEPR